MMEDDRPWYRQFWPWVLIALPGSVVIAAFITLWIAIKHDDSMVRDDYYKEGLAINRELSQSRYAREQGMSAQLVYDRATQAVEVILAGMGEHTGPAPLRLDVVHPNDSARDVELQLLRVGEGRYAGRSPVALEASPRWYLQLREATGAQSLWRLRGTLETEHAILDLTLRPD